MGAVITGEDDEGLAIGIFDGRKYLSNSMVYLYDEVAIGAGVTCAAKAWCREPWSVRSRKGNVQKERRAAGMFMDECSGFFRCSGQHILMPESRCHRAGPPEAFAASPARLAGSDVLRWWGSDIFVLYIYVWRKVQ